MTFSEITQFFQEAYSELRKSAWLSRKEMVGSTVVVLILVLLTALYIGGVDFVISIFFGSILGGRR